ncbi:MAG: CDP-glycerol glycerophosphotransferase family protein [Lentisphaeria bacterium]|nr:CDP-glycerol glycerophosphotransferase family protein [Lentisphaeria bacterium]
MTDAGGKPIVFFSKMAQGVPSLGPPQREAGGVFITNRRETLTFFQRNFPGLAALKHRKLLASLQASHRCLRAAAVIVSGAPHTSVLGRYQAKRAMIFHGTFRNLTKVGIQQLKDFDHVFLNGPRMERMLNRHPDLITFSATVSGYTPFADFPQPSPEHRRNVFSKLNLDPGKKLVFYAPARRGCGSWTACAEKIATDLPDDCVLVMRPHPNQALHGTAAEKALYQRLTALFDTRRNGLIDLATCSFPELLSVADLLISDATSPTEEFMLYNRPQIITETYPRGKWRENYQHDGMHQDDIDELMGLYDCAWSFEKDGFKNWRQAIQTALAEPEKHRGIQRRYFASAFGETITDAPARVAEVLTRGVG